MRIKTFILHKDLNLKVKTLLASSESGFFREELPENSALAVFKMSQYNFFLLNILKENYVHDFYDIT